MKTFPATNNIPFVKSAPATLPARGASRLAFEQQ